jgi:flavin-dependent dehydrogenase
MDDCDVLIVGAGPAGTSCAWRLRGSGLEVVILEKARFPRDKVCGGWVTPPVLDELEIDPEDYSSRRVLQPITGFRTSRFDGPEVVTHYRRTVSYGIRRCEFDHYLAARSGARILEDTPLRQLQRCDGGWIANGSIRARLLVGAGGHFCPVARFTGARMGTEPVVAAQEIEFLMTERQRARCSVSPEVPELFFCADMKGYGWCFRKRDYLNVGLGRLDRLHLTRHVAAFVSFLRRSGKIPEDTPAAFPGHAYLLWGTAERSCAGDRLLLIGDAAGLAYAQSGEGIRPAVESGLLAADVIREASGDFTAARLERYRTLLEDRFGGSGGEWVRRLAQRIPERAIGAIAGTLMATRWFSRRILLDRWFLH